LVLRESALTENDFGSFILASTPPYKLTWFPHRRIGEMLSARGLIVIAAQQHLKIIGRGGPNYLSHPASRGSTETMMLLNQAEIVLPQAPAICACSTNPNAKLNLSLLAYTEVRRDVGALSLSAFLLSRRYASLQH
jgi:hypothetical protein